MRVLFASMAAAGHTYPLIPLAQAMHKAGHEVHFAVGEEMHPVLGKLGLRPFRPGLVFGEIYAEDIAQELERLLPDLVIGGWAVPEVVAEARRRGFPALWHGFGRMFPAGIGLVRPTGGRHLDICPPSLQDANFLREERIPLRAVPFSTPGDVPVRTAGKLVYLTLGTAFGTRELLAEAVVGLGKIPEVQVVVAAPHVTLGHVPPNVTVYPWLPQAEVLRYADVAVHHGGSGTMLGALVAGVPQVVLPQGADQFGNADALVAAGAALRPAAFSAGPIADCVRRLLTDSSYREAAGQLAREIRHTPSPEEVADSLADVV
ncbi:UDP-glucoronosyl and UDP-glucosyl transferase [Lentzea albidocapillata subsp. violacea]|uniref:UDP-glucoronosyl and UDP-glucosyl transferase n=1 Tax=Lentzea albidocapillata subsp. violacea TaxID=128104 RepID=A0A1G9MF35_9PSEU|nr:nucleotide disphospho-sugar-binding domain-containing protein [Lentzea albidocapillata]SDL72870.1 UDP-glucoronosyl and UDP-glucosyl transferase [Lentzea albidocapillata subsp. violacea]